MIFFLKELYLKSSLFFFLFFRVARHSLFNATALNLIRTVYDETTAFHVLTSPALDLVLSKMNKSH